MRPTSNISQIAALYRVGRRTVYNWIRAGILDVKVGAHGMRVYSDVLPRYIGTIQQGRAATSHLNCVSCGKRAEPEGLRCAECITADREKARQHRARRKAVPPSIEVRPWPDSALS